MVTHNPDVAVGAQRVVHMRDGHVTVEQADVEAVPTA